MSIETRIERLERSAPANGAALIRRLEAMTEAEAAVELRSMDDASLLAILRVGYDSLPASDVPEEMLTRMAAGKEPY